MNYHINDSDRFEFRYTYDDSPENFTNFLENIIPHINTEKFILDVSSTITLNKKIKIDTSNIRIIVLNIKGSLSINQPLSTNTDLVINVSDNLSVCSDVVCGGKKLFIKCGHFLLLGKTASIYSYGDLFIFGDGGISIGEPTTGIETENGYSYRRVVKSDSFISSNGNITLSSKCGDVIIGFCYIISNKNLNLGLKSDISNINVVCSTLRSITGNVMYQSKGKLTLKRTDEKLHRIVQGYPFLGATANHMAASSRTSITVELKHEYPSSGPTIIEALGDIIFEGGSIINSASIIMCGGKFISGNYKEVPLDLGTISKRPRIEPSVWNYEVSVYAYTGWWTDPYNAEHVGTSYCNPSRISFTDYYLPNQFTYVCTVKTGESISLNMGTFVISGNFLSQNINISGQSSSFSHLSKGRSPNSLMTSPSQETTIINVNEYISQNLSPLENISKGVIVNKYPMDIQENQSEIPTIVNDSTTPQNLKDPIINISISHHLQKILSEITNKVFIENTSQPSYINSGLSSNLGKYSYGQSLLDSLIENTHSVLKEMGNLQTPNKSIIYKKESEGGIIDNFFGHPSIREEMEYS